jgi:hypothetical protein
MFKQLEPPPGGAERFARRLDEISVERHSPRGRMVAIAAAIAGVALVAATLLLRQPGVAPPVTTANGRPAVDVYNAPELDRLLGRTAMPAELMVTVNMKTADVTEIESTNQKVRLYQVN